MRMKSCPTCQRTFEETLTFCLVDGSVLSAPSGANDIPGITDSHRSDPAATKVLNPTTRAGGSRHSDLSTIVSPQPLPLYSPKQQLAEKPRGKPWMAIGIASSVVVIFVVGAILGVIWLGRKSAGGSESNSNVENVNLKPSPTATAATGDGGWEAMTDKTSLNGENLTYYPGTTPEQCRADCDKDVRCKGFTFIRAGAYNPNDSAMCYQAAVVTGSATHPCCISAIKRK